MSRRSLVSSLVLGTVAMALAAGGALADITAAEKAFEQKDYATARKELDPATVKASPDARLMLGIMERDGLAGPVDPKAAFIDLSLAIMSSDNEGLHDFAFRARRKAALGMSVDEITAAERSVGATAAEGAGLSGMALKKKIMEIKSDLASCKSKCESPASEAFRLGPAASDTIPELEALMTRDQMWMPRLEYAQTLAVIGSKAAPALGRIMLDKKQMAAEGPWNLQAAAQALGQMGPAAYAARPLLVKALTADFDNSKAEFNEMGTEVTGQSPQAMLDQAKVQVASALAQIGDPKREVYAPLAQVRDHGADPVDRLLVALAMAMTYREIDPLMQAMATTLDGNDSRAQSFALQIMPLIMEGKVSREKAQDLFPAVRKLSSSKDAEVRKSARDTLNTLMQEQRWAVADLLRDKNYKGANDKANELLAIAPWNAELLQLRAEAKRGSGDIEGAIADYKSSMAAGDVFGVQFMLHDAGKLTEEEETGKADAKTMKALESCVRDDACFAKMKH